MPGTDRELRGGNQKLAKLTGKRLQFAKDYITKRTDFWDTVLFSDESKFNIFKNSGPISV